MAGQINVTRDSNVILIELCNLASRNALSSVMVLQLIDALQNASADQDCRAIVLSGSGGQFCAGGDVSAMVAERPLLDSRLRVERAHHIIRLLNGGPKPVFAAVEGAAFGLGLSLALACDYVIASKDSKLCAVFNKVGLLPDMGLLYTLPQRVGVARAKQLIFSAKTLSGEEALALGIVDTLVESGNTLNTALEQAKSLIHSAPVPIALTKAAYAKGLSSLEEALRNEVDHQPALYLTADHIEGVTAFREKRKPVFQGK